MNDLTGQINPTNPTILNPKTKYKVAAIFRRNPVCIATAFRLIDKNIDDNYPITYENDEWSLNKKFIIEIQPQDINEENVNLIENLELCEDGLYILNKYRCGPQYADKYHVEHVSDTIASEIGVGTIYTDFIEHGSIYRNTIEKSFYQWCKEDFCDEEFNGNQILNEYIESKQNYILPTEISCESNQSAYFKCYRCNKINERSINNYKKCRLCDTSTPERCIGRWLALELPYFYTGMMKETKSKDILYYSICFAALDLLIEIHSNFESLKEFNEELKHYPERHNMLYDGTSLLQIIGLNGDEAVEKARQAAKESGKADSLIFFNSAPIRRCCIDKPDDLEKLNKLAKQIQEYFKDKYDIHIENLIDEYIYKRDPMAITRHVFRED